MNRLSAAIIAFNEETNIGRCLESLKGVAGEIIVVDSHSSDGTARICNEHGCRVFQREFTGYSEQKQFAVDAASNDWVLSIDADEELTPELKREITAFLANDPPAVNGCYIKRDLVYLGREMKFGSASGEKILRLFNRRHGRFDGAPVHEKVMLDGPSVTLKGRLLHYSYRDEGKHLEKISEYTLRAAEENVRRGKQYPAVWVPVKFCTTFFTIYIMKGGIFDGRAGYVWALMSALYAAIKISRTIELTKTLQGK